MKLVKPDVRYKKSFLKLTKKAAFSHEKIPWFIKYSLYDFEGIVEMLNNFEKKFNLKENEVPSTTYFAVFKKHIAGVINIKHELNQRLKSYGHIGYFVFKSFRKKGIATKMLSLALIEAKKLNLETVTICIDKSNIASKKVALKNNLILSDKFFDTNQKIIIERYVIDLN
ncbi:MAG: GNAT family N-acetyltransferase [Firmicutes bacterium]|nr:GNAT family N-acetyltransferase [Bacillota bacterium]